MKKIISVFLSIAMLSATVVSAAYNSKIDILNDSSVRELGITGYRNIVDQTVKADILVRKAGASTYVDGPINVEKTASEQFPKFDFKAEFEMSDVWRLMEEYIANGSLLVSAPADLNAVPVTGEFVVKVIYPKNLKVPATFTEAGGLYGFNNEVKRSGTFTEISRNVSAYDSSNNVLTIIVVVSDTCGGLRTAYNSASPKFELECLGVQPATYGTYTVKGEVTGKIKIGDPTIVNEADYIGVVNYNAVQKGTASNATLSASVSVTEKSGQQGGTTGGGSGGGGGMYIPPTTSEGIKIEFDINGNRDVIEPLTGATSVTVDYDSIKPAPIDGMTFDGWYIDPGFTTKLTGKETVVTNLVLYGRYVITTAPSVFDGAHKAYIKGYPDGTVQPMGLITREEITTALYRLLKDSVVAGITTNKNNFEDVDADRWSNTSISSMSNGGYIKGYEDGTFRPANDITRAEFATLVLRFFDNTDAFAAVNNFSDVSGHWAEANIVKADAMGLFNGYEDGTFRPDAYITRAEAMAVINRITVRRSNNNSFIGDFINWPDISTSDWYYADVIEATNTHDFTRIDDVMTEKWTDVSYIDLIVG